MITNNLVEETLDELILSLEKDSLTFFKSYRSLPFALYVEIERLSVSKSALFKNLCDKARLVAESFHRSIK